MKNKIVSFSRNFFDLEKIFFRKIFFAISIRNFPRNPKMILRKPCGQPTDRVAGIPEITDPKRSFFFRIWKIPWYFGNELSGGSLKDILPYKISDFRVLLRGFYPTK